MFVIEARGLSKRYGKIKALHNIDLNINKGEILGLLGPNGAGKSTLVALLAGLIKPDTGEILINGIDITKQGQNIKKILGYVPQELALYPMLSGIDNLKFWAGVYGLQGKESNNRVEEVLDLIKLKDRAKDKVEEYSGGMKRRLNIGASLLHRPQILFMDEPTVGVDLPSRKCIMDAVIDIKNNGNTIIFTSHYMDEMETLCDKLAILNKGCIETLGTLEELRRSYGMNKLEEILLSLED